MRVSKEQASKNRERVLQIAAQLYREHGFAGIGVADIMKAAGLTHGGFYGQFSSKEDLMAQACERALADIETLWDGLAAGAPDSALDIITHAYLSAAHRDQPGVGCTVAALGADIARQPASVRQRVTVGVQKLIAHLTRYSPGKSTAAKREHALATYASLVGALVLARSVDDPALSDEILHTVEKSLHQRSLNT